MAVDMFLKLNGIDGEAKDSKHKGTIDVLAWSWGLSQAADIHTGGGGGAGKANFQDLSLTKWVEKSSATLMYHTAAGKHIPDATLIVRKAGDKPLEYIKVTLTDVLVSSYTTGGSGGEDRLTENVTLHFAKIKFDYQEQKSDGSGTPAGAFGWDIPSNVKI